MRSFALLGAVLFVGACADAGDRDDDAEAEAATGQAVAGTLTGVYRSHATTHYNGDVPNLELRAGNTYVRTRCYHASCAIKTPETDAYETYTSSGGKTYLRFKTVTVTVDPTTGVDTQPTVADVYEVKKVSNGIKLRKAYSTRWQLLYTSSLADQCNTSGGMWDLDACNCPGNVPGAWPVTTFVAGAGGCIATPGADESACDASGGLWTDDDATAVGSYCVCGADRYLTAAGACADL